MTVRPLVWGLLVVGGGALAGEPPGLTAPVPEVMKELRRIESAAWHGALDATRMQLEALSKSRPADPMLRVYVAWCSMPTDDAWNQLKNITQIYPDLAWAHYGMARIYVGWKMHDQARSALDQAMKKNLTFYPALVAFGDMARLKEDWAEAEKQYRAALAIEDDAEARAGLGLALHGQGKAGPAMAELSRAIALWPDQPAALKALLALQQAAKDPAAVKTLSTLAELQPRDREIRLQVANLKFDAGDKAGALREYEKLLKLGNPSPEIAERMMVLYREAKDAEGEERAAALLASLDKSAVAPVVRGAELKEARKDLDGAEKLLLEALERDRELADTWFRLGAISNAKGQPVAALERFRKGALKATPRADECKAEAKKLEEIFKLPAKPAKGSVDRIYGLVAKGLEDFYWLRRKGKPELKGTLKVRVKVSAEGVVEASEIVEDTLNDAPLAGHAVFALRDAEFEKRRREPIFEFELGVPPSKKGK